MGKLHKNISVFLSLVEYSDHLQDEMKLHLCFNFFFLAKVAGNSDGKFHRITTQFTISFS